MMILLVPPDASIQVEAVSPVDEPVDFGHENASFEAEFWAGALLLLAEGMFVIYRFTGPDKKSVRRSGWVLG